MKDFQQKISQISNQHFFLLLFLIRLPFLFLPINWGDFNVTFWNGEAFFLGYLPYRDFETSYYLSHHIGIHIHPPGFYYLYTALVWLSGHDPIFFSYLIKLFWIGTDLAILVVVYKILSQNRNQKSSRFILIFYIFSPFSIVLVSYLGMDEIITLFCSLMGFFYIYKNKHIHSAIWMSFGILHAILPIFYIPLILILFYKRGEIKKLIGFLISVISICLLFSLPFLIILPNEFIHSLVKIIARGSSISLLPDGIRDILKNPLTDYSVLSFLSCFFLIQMIILGLFYYQSFQKLSSSSGLGEIIPCVLKFHMFLPIILLSGHHRLFYWFFVYLIVLLGQKGRIEYNSNLINKNFRFSLILTYSFFIISGIYYYVKWEDQYYAMTEATTWYRSYLLFFIIFSIVWIYIQFSSPIFRIQSIALLWIGIAMTISACVLSFLGDLGLTENTKFLGLLCYMFSVFAFFKQEYLFHKEKAQ